MNGKKSAEEEFLTTFDLHELIADTSWSVLAHFILQHWIDFGKHSSDDLLVIISIDRSVVYFFYWLVNSFFTTHILTFSQFKISRFLRRSSCRSLYSLYISLSLYLIHIQQEHLLCVIFSSIFCFPSNSSCERLLCEKQK